MPSDPIILAFDTSAAHCAAALLAHWDVGLALPEGDVLARDLPLLRARSIWVASLALGAGGRAADVPAALRGEIAGA